MKKGKFIHLPTGEAIRADIITAVRKGDAEPGTKYCSAMVPRVIVDFGNDHTNSVICFCKTDDERDELAKHIREEICGKEPIDDFITKFNGLLTDALSTYKSQATKKKSAPLHQGDIVAIRPRASLWQKIKNALTWLEGRR